ncbi:MAG: domain protein (2Fe-2S)-binding domain protein [Thermomicrobiales bacterium]|nr:domain protein (2Fe-2S)-binding domain protein [Thermomicrobiales bacterium]
MQRRQRRTNSPSTSCTSISRCAPAALAEVGRVLNAAGVEVSVRKSLVASVEQARALGFISSPTIRVNGTDIALELRESSCAECGEVCACDGTIDCRVWVWQGQEHTEAPSAMIVDAILREVYGGERATAPLPVGAVPENLARFFISKERLAASASCCPPAEPVACCESSEKASCCGDGDSESCECR